MTNRLRAAALAALLLTMATQARAATFTLEATPATVAWGNYDATAKPVLTIKSATRWSSTPS